MDNELADLLVTIEDLIVQATHERSHYYTAACLNKAKLALIRQNKTIEQLETDNAYLLSK